MKLNNLKPAAGATHSRRRLGRGPGSGLGGTSTRGHKGAKARSGYKNKVGFEGGQMPLQRRLPKFGFKITKIGLEELVAAGVVNAKGLVKVLGNGKLTAKVEVVANAFSKTAEAAIQAVGGTATKL